MTHRAGTYQPRRPAARRKNQALRRWLRRVATRPDTRGEQWWKEFDALLRRTRTRLRPVDA
jgi:hypothetical protein